MATLTPTNPRVFTGHMATQKLLSDTDATWKAGAFLQVNIEGYLQPCESNAVQITHMALTDQDAAPGNTTTEVSVGIVTADLEFLINELDGTVALTDVGDTFAIDKTADVTTLDIGDATNAALYLVDPLWNRDSLKNASADVKARCIVRVPQAVIDATPAAAI